MSSPSRPVAAAESAAEGMLAIWHDVAPGCESLVRDWYNEEHHAERLALPGFLSAHRYERVSGDGAAIMTLYRTTAPEVMSSASYRERLQHPSERTRAAMPAYRNMCRTVCHVVATEGGADGGAVAVLAAAYEHSPSARSPSGLSADALVQALAVPPGISGVLRWRCIVHAAPAQADGASIERSLRKASDSEIAWALLVDANCESDAIEGLAKIVDRIGPLAEGALIRYRACYRLVYANHRQMP